MDTLSAVLATAVILAPVSMAQSEAPASGANAQCEVELVVLGTAQDAGSPQIGHPDDPAWADPSLRRLATSLGVVDYDTGERILFEATPDMREQLFRLDRVLVPDSQPGLADEGERYCLGE